MRSRRSKRLAQVHLIICRRNAVDAGSTVLAGQPVGLFHAVQIDDVVERAQRRPFVLAQLAIRCRFVDRFVGSRAPSRVSGQRFSTHDAFLPSVGSRRARFPVFIGTMKALRLPAAQTRSLMVSVTGSTRPSRICVRQGAHDEIGGSSSGLEHLFSRRSVPGRLHPWARAGSRRFPGDPSQTSALL